MADKSQQAKESTTNDSNAPAKKEEWKDTRMQKISKNLGDIVAERRKLLLENAKADEREQKVSFKRKKLFLVSKNLFPTHLNTSNFQSKKRSKSRDSAPKSLQYETVRFPLAVFDVCQQQLPMLEQCSKWERKKQRFLPFLVWIRAMSTTGPKMKLNEKLTLYLAGLYL